MIFTIDLLVLNLILATVAKMQRDKCVRAEQEQAEKEACSLQAIFCRKLQQEWHDFSRRAAERPH